MLDCPYQRNLLEVHVAFQNKKHGEVWIKHSYISGASGSTSPHVCRLKQAEPVEGSFGDHSKCTRHRWRNWATPWYPPCYPEICHCFRHSGRWYPPFSVKPILAMITWGWLFCTGVSHPHTYCSRKGFGFTSMKRSPRHVAYHIYHALTVTHVEMYHRQKWLDIPKRCHVVSWSAGKNHNLSRWNRRDITVWCKLHSISIPSPKTCG